MSVTGLITQVPQLIIEQAKLAPSVIKLFRSIASLIRISENIEYPRIKDLQYLSTERISLLCEILPEPEYAVGRWTLADLSELEFWKAQYPQDYLIIKNDIDKLVDATRINRHLWINRAWDILNYIFTGYTSDEELPFLVCEDRDIPIINLFWSGKVILAKNGEIEANYLEKTEVQEIAQALSRMTEQKIRQRFEQGLNLQPDLYHFSWGEQNYEWLLEMCMDVKKFYNDAANQESAMLINID